MNKKFLRKFRFLPRLGINNIIERQKVKFLIIFSIGLFFICFLGILISIFRNTLHSRPGMIILFFLSIFSLVLIYIRKYKLFLYFFPISILFVMSTVALMGGFTGHEGIYLPVTILLFLMLTTYRLTKFVIFLNYIIVIIIYFQKKESLGLNPKLLIDSIFGITFFSVISFGLVGIMNDYINRIEKQTKKLKNSLLKERELSSLLMDQPDIRTHRTYISENLKKYSKSGLKEEDIKPLIIFILKYMDEEKPYLNDELKLQTLAEKLNIKPNYLSQIINENLGKNFYTFVNSYRIQEYINKRNDPVFKEYTNYRLAMTCGFHSKSSFHSIFKKLTGKLPSQIHEIVGTPQEIGELIE